MREERESPFQGRAVRYLRTALAPYGGWAGAIPGGDRRATRSPGYVKGTPDVLCVVRGQCVLVELKSVKGVVREDQKVLQRLLAEAAACARRSGIDDAVFVEVLEKGGGWGAALERLKPYLLRGETSGLRFSMANALKDLGYYADMAQGAGAHDAAAQALQATLAAACQAVDPQTLVPELVGVLQKGPLKG